MTGEKLLSPLHRGRSEAGQCRRPVPPIAGAGLGTTDPGFPPCRPLLSASLRLQAPMAAAALLDLAQVGAAIPRSSPDPNFKAPNEGSCSDHSPGRCGQDSGMLVSGVPISEPVREMGYLQAEGPVCAEA